MESASLTGLDFDRSLPDFQMPISMHISKDRGNLPEAIQEEIEGEDEDVTNDEDLVV